MKIWIKIILLSITCIFLLPGLIYLGLAIYYKDSFMYGTWINGIYCTGKTIEEAAAELENNFSYDKIIVEMGDYREELSTEAIDMEADFISSLKEYRKQQNPLFWYVSLFADESKEFFPYLTYDEKKLEEWLYGTRLYQDNLSLKEDSISIEHSRNGYILKEKKAKILNCEKANLIIKDAIINAEKYVDLEESGCIFYRDETVDMMEIRKSFEKIEHFQQQQLTYHLKDEIKKITSGELSLFIAADKDGKVLYDKNGEIIINKMEVENFVSKMAEEYDTYHNHSFTTHDGEEIIITKGNYGTQLDQRKEVNFLMNWCKDPKESDRYPVYLRDITFDDKNKIEDTYIEIDMEKQIMIYWVNGEELLRSDVVTGCVNKGMATPEIVCYVRAKSRNAILKGENYRSFVNYWMPVYGGIGIHDASWRDVFGGDIYIKSGSHGCINTPLEKMADMFERVEIGTPVVIYR